jgi:hypothetical protein
MINFFSSQKIELVYALISHEFRHVATALRHKRGVKKETQFFKYILKGSDDGVQHSELLGFFDFFIVSRVPDDEESAKTQ